jgi:hypothetical protein
MGEQRSPNGTSGDLLASFHKGYLKQISQQLVTMRAELKSGQDRLQATSDSHLVLTGRVLEAVRMGKPAGQPSGAVKSLWGELKEWLSGFVLLHKVWSAWRAISWPVSLGVWGSAVAKFFGLW